MLPNSTQNEHLQNWQRLNIFPNLDALVVSSTFTFDWAAFAQLYLSMELFLTNQRGTIAT